MVCIFYKLRYLFCPLVICQSLSLLPSGMGHLHHLQVSEDPRGSRWHRTGAVYPGVIKCTHAQEQHILWRACKAGNDWPSPRPWLSIFFVSIETSYTVALLTAPSLWVTCISLLPPVRATLYTFNCEHLYKLCFCLSVVCCCCAGVGHPDPAESQYYPCPWQPCMHTGLLPQHVVQRLTQGH